MTSLLWYICLASVFFAACAYIIYKKSHTYKISTLIAFCLFATSITWIGEFIVLGIFDSYAYKPGISADPWAENLAGHLFLNASMFPAAALLISTYKFSYWKFSLVISAFLLPEYLFLRLGIYQHHWWRYYMSAINVINFMIIVKNWFGHIKYAHYRLPRLITFYFIALPVIHTPMPFLLLLGKQYYSLGLINNLVGNMYRSSIIFIFSYHLIENLFFVFFVCVLDRWYWKLIPFVIAAAVQSILAATGILRFQEGWKLSYTLLLYFISIGLFILIEKHSLKPDNQ